MSDMRAWIVVPIVVVLLVVLLAYARGPEHHRGNEVGAHSSVDVTIGQ
ncbi:hypothetical protein [Aeromicrobium sp.]|nr:hypothetical protein [Aeromicrobium sp.]